MRKKIGTLLIVGSLGALCAGLCACNSENTIDKHRNEGNVISVTYDGSGGNIAGGDNVTLVDMFNPDKYTADADGYVHIKLREPTDPDRPKLGVDNIKVDRGEYALVGWYRTRSLALKDGKVVDEAGNELTERDGDYFTVRVNNKGEEVYEKAIPAYNFSDPWDFENDRVEYKKGDEPLDMTLYAAWIQPYTFEYYYKPDANSEEWTRFATTSFNYIGAQAENEKEDGDPTKTVYDSVFIPQWSLGSEGTGRMEHKHSDAYTFPSLSNMTFKAAYSDAACTHEITVGTPLQHGGSLDYSTATPVDSVQKVYVQFDTGNRYMISTPAQFAAIADPTGIYTILTDELDFNCSLTNGELTFPLGGSSIRWPNALMTATFTGSILGENGAVKFKNVGAQYSGNATLGGLFGSIGSKAVIKNVTFENVIFDVKSATSSREASFGMLAGTIEANATLEGISIGGAYRLWDVNIGASIRHFNLIANGSAEGITDTGITLTVCGTFLYGSEGSEATGNYEFSIDPTAGKTTVDAQGNITFVSTPSYPVSARRFQGQFHAVEYQTVNGGQENE